MIRAAVFVAALGTGCNAASSSVAGADGPAAPIDARAGSADARAGSADAPAASADAPAASADAPAPRADAAASADAAAASPDGPASAPAAGAHVEADYGVGEDGSLAPLQTPAVVTAASGSTFVACIGRGHKDSFAALGPPTDGQGNVYGELDVVHPYAGFPESGTAAYAAPHAAGASALQISAANGRNSSGNADEITLFFVEVRRASAVHDVAWNQVEPSQPPTTVTSATVTTSGPATLVACWFGDASALSHIEPDASFTLLDQELEATSHVQGALAVRNVAAAGTYSVTWTATPAQNAQMWLIAVE